MATTVQVFGLVSIFLIGIGAILHGIAWLWEIIGRYRYVSDYKHQELMTRRIGSDLKRQCHWFTENTAAWVALDCLADDMVLSGRIDISAIRDAWRKDSRLDLGGQG